MWGERERERKEQGGSAGKGEGPVVGSRTDAARMMRCNHKPHSECSGVCQHTHIHIPLSVSSMTQIERAMRECVCFSTHTHTH